jgi:hypothetical protein
MKVSLAGSDANSSDDLEEIRFGVATRNILEGIEPHLFT